MADIAQILAEVVLSAQAALATWKQFGQAGNAAFKHVQSGAATATSSINASLAKIGAGLTAVGTKAKAVGAAMKGVGQSISVGVTAPATLLFHTAVKSFEAAEQSTARLKGQFAATGAAAKQSLPEMLAFAGAIQKEFPASDEAVQDLQSTLLQFHNITGEQFKGARQAAIDWAVATGKSVEDVGQTLGKALNDPLKGLRALREAGIALTEEQQQQLETWQKTGQIAKAQDFIIAHLTKTYHEAAVEISKTDASKAVIAANRLDDALEQVGERLIGIKITLLEFAASVVEAFNQLPEGTQRFIIGLVGLVAALGPILFIVGMIVSGFGSLAGGLAGLGPVLAGVVPTIVAFGSALFTVVAIIGEITVAILSALGWPVLVAAALGAVLVIVITHWDEVKAIVGAAMDWIAEKVVAAWEGLGSVVDIAIGLWQASWNLFFAYLNSKWAGLGDFVKGVLLGMVAPLTTAIQLAKDLWSWLTKAAAVPVRNKSGGGEKLALGGRIQGRAGIDQIPAWLSNNEFVHRVAAVRKYGLGFMNAVNQGRFPTSLAQGFASGGMVSRPRMSFATGGQSKAADRGFTLVIGDKAFTGLRAPVGTADEMLRFGREHQVRATGVNPPWFK